MSKLTAEQICLLGLSRNVWRRGAAAQISNLTYNEPTITENLLLDLVLSYPGTVEVVSFNPREEGDFGADWLWSFVNVNETSSLTMLVQAKRLKSEQKYTGLMQTIGNRVPPEKQIDALIATAARHNVPAMYAFYNHLSDAQRVRRRCQSLKDTDPDQIFGFGIAMAEAGSVYNALPDDTFDTHRAHSLHLHCLLCSKGSGRKGPDGSAGSIAEAMRDWRRQRRVPGSDDPREDEQLGFLNGLHPLVTLAREIKSEVSVDYDTSGIRDDLGVAGVVVLRDSKDVKSLPERKPRPR